MLHLAFGGRLLLFLFLGFLGCAGPSGFRALGFKVWAFGGVWGLGCFLKVSGFGGSRRA